MEYERVQKIQAGIISPTKLRMKLMGPHNRNKKDGSNSNSSGNSPKIDDADFVKNSLLARNCGYEDEATSHYRDVVSENDSLQLKELSVRENGESGGIGTLKCPKGDASSSNAIDPMKKEEENLDYDSNASSSSFEFHKGERRGHGQMTRSSISRPMSSKWNDAEKWIMGRQNGLPNPLKRNCFQTSNMVCRVAPESANSDFKLPIGRDGKAKWVEFFQPESQMGLEMFAFTSSDTQNCGRNLLIDPCSHSSDLKEVGHSDLRISVASSQDPADVEPVRTVSMRDMGTEMTPATSLEPSRTTTPMGESPLRSAASSIPSTPRRAGHFSTPVDQTNEEANNPLEKTGKKVLLSEEESKLETRREIVALGVQLGKTNIAAWASKDEQERKNSKRGSNAEMEEVKRLELVGRAMAWEEVEKSKQMARLKSEEIKIEAWESQQNAQIKAKMQSIEAQIEQMRAQAQAKMTSKIELTRQRSQGKRAAAEARKNREAERTSAQAEYIRQTGKIPTSHYICCGWLS